MGQCQFCGNEISDPEAERVGLIHDKLERLISLEGTVSGLLKTTEWWDSGLYHNDLIRLFSKYLSKASPQ